MSSSEEEWKVWTQRHRRTWREEGRVKTEFKMGVMLPQGFFWGWISMGGFFPRAFRGSIAQLTLWFWTSNLPNCERINFCCFEHPQEMLKYDYVDLIIDSVCNERDAGSIPGLGRSLGEGNGNPLQYSCLENPKDGGDWQSTVLYLENPMDKRLAGYTPWGCKESDTTKQLTHTNTRSWHAVPSLHGKMKGKMWKQWQIFFSWAAKSLQWLQPWNQKTLVPWKKSYDKPR